MRITYLKALALGFTLILLVKGFPMFMGIFGGKNSTHKVCEDCGGVHHNSACGKKTHHS